MLKKLLKGFLILVSVFVALILVVLSIIYFSENGKILLPVKEKDAFSDNIENYPELLHIQGNKIVNQSGEIISLRGLMPPDPDRLHKLNKFKKSYFTSIQESGANVIRIPVHPMNYHEDSFYLWRYLDSVVSWAGELNMYVIIDWHYIGNIDDGSGSEMPDLEVNPKDYTRQFWTQTAKYFKDVPNVIFEVFNEPASISPSVWARNAQEIVDIIRDQGAVQPIIVGGNNYSKDLSWVKERPIADDNIIYASHIYPMDKAARWDTYFGNVSENYPVLITEWGFMDDNRDTTVQNYLIGDKETYGAPFIEYLEEKGIGWVACWFDNTWEPQIFKEDYKSYTEYGKFIMEELQKYKDGSSLPN